jgi:dolichol-phosphate mannosyltransferase
VNVAALISQTDLAPPLVPDEAPNTAPRPGPELCIVVPTYNERANVPILVDAVSRVLASCDWELVFVDDNSPDGTVAVASAIGEVNGRVRCMRRIGRRAHAGACLEGLLASQARYLACMDADMQHDETLLVAMLDRMRAGDVDLVVASRYMSGGSAAGHNKHRAFLSHWSNVIVQRVLGVNLTDAMSGYFMIRRDAFHTVAPGISTQGYKLLLDILATRGVRLRTVEIPSTFRERLHGESKLDSKIALECVALVTAKLTRDAVSPRFLLFCLVGLTGLVVHLGILLALLKPEALSFGVAQTIATLSATTWNFILNNLLTFRDQRLSGRRFVTGLIRFHVVCAIGAVSNVGIASWIYSNGVYGNDARWWIAGLGGALIGAVWNFAVSVAFVWRQR